jgi:hypothetical protein
VRQEAWRQFLLLVLALYVSRRETAHAACF